MDERRKTERLNEENKVTITVYSEENNLSQAKIKDIFIDNYTKDISAFGAGIKTNISLPLDTLVELEFTSKGVREQIKTLGKVKWINVIIEDESYGAGVEFCGTPTDTIKKLEDYISWKLKDRLNNKRLSNIDSSDINTVETKELSPIKNKQWIKIAIISLYTIILIVALLKIFGYIPEFDGLFFPNTNKKVTKNFAHDSITTKSATLPAPPIAAPVTASAPEAMQKTKVIGNSDSKRYHLPDMKYYNAVKDYHRIEFDSETDAIKAGYNKAPQ